MKKAFAIVLMVSLVLGMAFAAKSSGLMVGAQAGYGAEFLKVSKDDSYIKINNGGFYFAGLAEYAFSDSLAGKVELGINTMGKAKYTIGSALGEANYTSGDASPMHFSAYVGADFGLELSKELNLYLGAGIDALIGKESNNDDAKVNAAIGLGLEAVGAYKVDKGIAITAGAKFGWHFINTDDDIDGAYSELGDNGVKVGNVSLKFFAGVTYTL